MAIEWFNSEDDITATKKYEFKKPVDFDIWIKAVEEKLKIKDYAAAPYKNSREYINDELLRLNLYFVIYVLQTNNLEVDQHIIGANKKYNTDQEILKILSSIINKSRFNLNIQTEIAFLQKQIEKYENLIAKKIEQSLNSGVNLSLYSLSNLFRLSNFELNIILICLAPELDLNYELIYGYLQNDYELKKPNVNLILKLLCASEDEEDFARLYFHPLSVLFQNNILYFTDDIEDKTKSILSKCIKLDNRIVNYLLDIDIPDSSICSYYTLIRPERTWDSVVMHSDVKNRLIKIGEEYSSHKNGIIFYFYGSYGSGKKITAEAFCKELGFLIIYIDLKNLSDNEKDFKNEIRLIVRETLLQNTALYLDHFDAINIDDYKTIQYQNIIINMLEYLSSIIFLAGETESRSLKDLRKYSFISIEFSIPSYSLRKQIWNMSLDDQYELSPDVDIDSVLGKFKFTGGQIQNAICDAKNNALLRAGSDNIEITSDDIAKAFRSQSNQKLSGMSQRIMPKSSWDDIVLPPDNIQQLREICNYVKYRQLVYNEWGFDRKFSTGKGLNVLFSGPSGTGKTMAADIIANELGLDLYKIDLSTIISKYIGETEKNLSKIFKEAETSNAILFFDEADAIFGKRSEVKDSHDRYANIEVNYLLQKMEEHEGIVVLATNFRKNIDDAFTRRMHFCVEFPFPDQEYRIEIWKNIFPESTPKSNDIDYSFLAKKFDISGGNIKNIAINAAFLSAGNSREVNMLHIMQAVKREYIKMGKLCSESDFGKYYSLINNN